MVLKETLQYKGKTYPIRKKLSNLKICKISPHVTTVVKSLTVKNKKYQRYYKKNIKYKIPIYPNLKVGDIISIGYIGRRLSASISHLKI